MSPHREIVELLPWYSGGTLPEDERRAVEAHLAGCAACERELRELDALRSAVVDSVEAGPSPSPAALDRLMERIDAYEAERQGAAARAGRFRRLREGWAAWWSRPAPALARVAVVAQLVVILALVGVVALQRRGEMEFGTAGGPGVAVVEGARVRVGFHPEATEAGIRAALASVGATIVDGPTALGLYTVALPARDSAAVESAVDRLRAAPAVRYAETIDQAP